MNYKSILPSMKAQKIIIYFLISILLVFLIRHNFIKHKNISTNYKKNHEFEEMKKFANLDNKDTDGDGLKDWQELLYKTNPEMEDTDGDGFSDWKEVEMGRDPIVFGVGKKNQIKIITDTKSDIAGFLEQKEDLLEYKKMLQKKIKQREKEVKQQIKSPFSDESDENKMSFKKERKDLNALADSVLIYLSNPVIKSAARLEKLFSVISDNKENRELDEDDVKYYKQIANLNLAVAEDLKTKQIEDSEIRLFKKSLVDAYDKIGKNLIFLINDYEKGLTEDRVEKIKNYGIGQADLLKTETKIFLFINTYKIKLKKEDAATIFSYSGN